MNTVDTQQLEMQKNCKPFFLDENGRKSDKIYSF